MLVDSLGTWVASFLDCNDRVWNDEVETFLDSLRHTPAQVILVAEETGWGVVPAYPLGRAFRDRLGDLVRRTTAVTDTTYLVVTGYVLNLTELGILLPSSPET